jgi:sec-independent protein translocase protein TatA
MGELSPWHWAIVIIVLVVLFGARRLPDAARSLGRSARILKAELRAGAEPPPDAPPATPRSADSRISSPQSDPRHD